MRERSTVDMLALALAVAGALTDIDAGETWAAVPPADGLGSHWVKVRREDGAGIYLSHDAYGGRVRIGGEWPEGDGFRPYKQEHITVSDARPGAAIAGDIRRRFFPWYLPEYARMAAQRDESVRRDQAARQLAGELAAIFGGTVRQTQGRNGHGYSVDGYRVDGLPESVSVVVATYGQVAHFAIDAKPERARELARFLAPLGKCSDCGAALDEQGICPSSETARRMAAAAGEGA